MVSAIIAVSSKPATEDGGWVTVFHGLKVRESKKHVSANTG